MFKIVIFETCAGISVTSAAQSFKVHMSNFDLIVFISILRFRLFA